MNGLDLFSGIGGISLALAPLVRTVAYCENDRYAQGVLLSRMGARQLDLAPIWDDVRTLRAGVLETDIDIITAGFPCQDISVAGTGKGLEGERSGLWSHVHRLVSDIRPPFVFLENVPAITGRGLSRILMELTALGYDSRWTIVSAAEVGAGHIRERWFLLSYANGVRLRKERRPQVGRDNSQRSGPLEPYYPCSPRGTAWAPTRLAQPRVARAGDGILYKVDRSRGLGNSVVPLQAREAFQRLLGIGGVA